MIYSYVIIWDGVYQLSKSPVHAFSVYQTHTYFQVSILINLWTMPVRMNGPHATTALSYTFILMLVKPRKNCSSKIIFTKRVILYFWNGSFTNKTFTISVTIFFLIPISKVKYHLLGKYYFWTTFFSGFHWHQYERVTQSSFCVRSIHSNGHCP